MQNLVVDPELHANIPPLPSDAMALLEASILTEGCRDAIVVWGDLLIDGRNRLEICQRHDVPFQTVNREFPSRSAARIWIIQNQFARRNLSPMERAELALELEAEVRAGARERQAHGMTAPGKTLTQNSAEPLPSGESRDAIARIAGVSHDTIAKAKAIKEDAIPEVREMARAGAISIHAASQISEMPDAMQESVAQAIQDGEKPSEAIKHVHVAQNSGENEWYTPEPFIVAAREVMGAIDTDPASCEIANRTVGATRFYTKMDDGLTQSWHGRVWMNPPYAQPLIRQFCDAVTEKYLSREISEAIVLVNNGTETAWGQLLLKAASAACFPASRVRFLDQDGKRGAPLQGQMIVYLGSSASLFRSAFSRFGAVL